MAAAVVVVMVVVVIVAVAAVAAEAVTVVVGLVPGSYAERLFLGYLGVWGRVIIPFC